MSEGGGPINKGAIFDNSDNSDIFLAAMRNISHAANNVIYSEVYISDKDGNARLGALVHLGLTIANKNLSGEYVDPIESEYRAFIHEIQKCFDAAKDDELGRVFFRTILGNSTGHFNALFAVGP